MTTTPAIRVALFDVAGTLTRGNTWTNLVKHPAIDPAKRRQLLRWGYPAWFGTKLRLVKEVDFRDKWVRGMARLIAGWQADQVRELYQWLIDEHAVPTFYPDVLEVVRNHKAQGVHVVLVSNMFADAVQMLAEQIGADKGLGSPLDMRDGVVTGTITGDTCSGPSKMDVVRAYLASQNITVDFKREVAAYSDSWSDRFMLEATAQPVAVYADSRLRRHAVAQGWTLLGDKSANTLDA